MQLRNNMVAQYTNSSFSTRSFMSSAAYFLLKKKLVSSARRMVAKADMQEKALISMGGLTAKLVARLRADLPLVLSIMPLSVKP